MLWWKWNLYRLLNVVTISKKTMRNTATEQLFYCHNDLIIKLPHVDEVCQGEVGMVKKVVEGM